MWACLEGGAENHLKWKLVARSDELNMITLNAFVDFVFASDFAYRKYYIMKQTGY